EFHLGTMSLEECRAATARLQSDSAAVEAKRIELTGLMDARDDHGRELAELVTRARSGFRATYGPDSAQYEQAGGTRKSERKPRAKKVRQG
ncbi:MAG: hypothetical protein HY784_09155, partial [Chloroflexi bacterium]|nr:hypothetical protein [Chloroflexota bacterium]